MTRSRSYGWSALLLLSCAVAGCSSGDGASNGGASCPTCNGASGGNGSSGGDCGAACHGGSGGNGGSDAGADSGGPLPPAKGAPIVLYTDIASGPNSGGESNLGAYLSIFGKNFGNAGLGSTIKVTIGGTEVASYVSLGWSKGRSDIEQIVVRVGALGNPAAGTPLKVQVAVAGVTSNDDQTFVVNPGHFIYVDPVNGNDSTGAVDDVTKPFKTVQSSATGAQATAWGHVHAGDTIVLRAGTYQGVGFEHYFMRFIIATSGYSTGTSGTAPTGTAGTGPIALIAYPGEDAFIDGDSSFDSAGCLAGLNGENYPNAGKWITIANLRIEGGGYDGPISQEIHGDHWRVVNNEITATTGVTSGASPSRMAGITGNGAGAAWLGNHIHDIQGSQNEAHGIYIDGDGDYDIAYNVIHDCKSGKGIQTYSNGENGSDTISNVRIHHNIVHDVAQFGINVADGSKDGFEIYDNVVYSAKTGGLRFNTTTLAGAKIYNNTFADDDTSKDESSAALMSDWNLAAGALDVKNNIFVATTGTALTGGSVGISASVGTFANNVWFGDAAPSFDSTAVVSDPNFVTPGSDFHLQSGSPAAGSGSSAVSTLVVDDFDLEPWTSGKYDIGAYAEEN